MKRGTFFLAYAATLAPPVLTYVLTLGAPRGTAYALSMAFGASAFVILANQFILASRPAFAVKALGVKGLLSFHATMPIAAVALAFAHKVLKVGIVENRLPIEDPGAALSRPVSEALKEGLGFVDGTFQTMFGSFALIVTIALAVVAVAFMANTVFMRIKPLVRLKSWVYSKIGLQYRFFRAIHNALALAGLALIAHVLFAASGLEAGLPIGMAWSLAWMAFALALYARYKIRTKKQAKAA
jgi:predicted ferric reductase